MVLADSLGGRSLHPIPSAHQERCFQAQKLVTDQEVPVAAQPLMYYIGEDPQEAKFRELRALTSKHPLDFYLSIQRLCLWAVQDGAG